MAFIPICALFAMDQLYFFIPTVIFAVLRIYGFFALWVLWPNQKQVSICEEKESNYEVIELTTPTVENTSSVVHDVDSMNSKKNTE